MPYGTDIFQVEEIGKRACARAHDAGAKVILLPTIPFGVNTNHLKVPGALACLLRVQVDRHHSVDAALLPNLDGCVTQ